MKKRFKYGFTWVSLFWTFLILGAVALTAMWLSFQIDVPVNILGLEVEASSASLVVMVIGAFFALGAGIVVSLMFQQRGMSPYILLEKKTLILPVTGRGEVKLPLAEIETWQVVTKSTRKTIRMEHAGRRYVIESRLMSNADDFDVLVSALRAAAGKREQVETK